MVEEREPDLPEDAPTPLTCRDCGGRWKIQHESGTVTTCRWCVRGAQTAEMFKRWQAKRRRTPYPGR